jgi:hypothetical protein
LSRIKLFDFDVLKSFDAFFLWATLGSLVQDATGVANIDCRGGVGVRRKKFKRFRSAIEVMLIVARSSTILTAGKAIFC